jgi:hypothetical protein
MADWVVQVTQKAIETIEGVAGQIGLENTEEFTFRSHFMLAAKQILDPPPVFISEWDRFDLLVSRTNDRSIIEFKYHVLRPRLDIDGKAVGFKGGAGKKNEGEFKKCIKKLRDYSNPKVQSKYMVLIYQVKYQKQSKHSYHSSYGELKSDDDILMVSRVEGPGQLAARVLTIRN